MAHVSVEWTNRSVLAFAQGEDPIDKIERKAREVAFAAIEQGWSGPPFDPIRLADLLKIAVAPRDDIRDARTAPVGSKSARIEFNPNRSRGRVRFSIAHEIAHTFFSDFAERVRNRSSYHEIKGDEWQLELLCNIAAAELIMPVGSFRDVDFENLDIDHILDVRREFDVSIESVLIRMIKLTREPCAIFCASRLEGGAEKDRYRIDYAIPSASWHHRLPSANLLPPSSVVGQCTAIGYTAKGKERWFEYQQKLMVQCVGIPPYPGARYPRVAGLVSDQSSRSEDSELQILYVRGDALNPRAGDRRIIAQIVPDRTTKWGGGGFAAAMRRRLPNVQSDFQAWAQGHPQQFALGAVHVCAASPSVEVVSMVAQRGFGRSTKPRIRYSALDSCLVQLADHAIAVKASVHMPRIGTGHAGGSWPIIEELVTNRLLRRGIRVTIYDLPEPSPRRAEDGFLGGAVSVKQQRPSLDRAQQSDPTFRTDLLREDRVR